MDSNGEAKNKKKMPEMRRAILDAYPKADEIMATTEELGLLGTILADNPSLNLLDALELAAKKHAPTYKSLTKEQLMHTLARMEIEYMWLLVGYKKMLLQNQKDALLREKTRAREENRLNAGNKKKESYNRDRQTIKQVYLQLKQQNNKSPTNEQVLTELNRLEGKGNRKLAYPRIRRGKPVETADDPGKLGNAWSESFVSKALSEIRKNEKSQPSS